MALPEEQKEVPFLLVEGDGIVIKGKGKRKEEIHRVQIAEGVTTSGEKKETEKSDICVIVEISERCMGEKQRFI